MWFSRYKFPNGSLYFEQVEHSKSSRPDEGVYQCVGSVPGLGVLVSKKADLHVACGYTQGASLYMISLQVKVT